MAEITPVNTGPAPETGIHMGSFMLYPTLSIGGQYNDNVFAQDTGAKSDVSLEVHPSARLESTWSHALIALKAEYDMTRYNKFSQEDTNDYLFGGEGKFDLGSDTQIDATSEYAGLSELPGDTNILVNAAKPTFYQRWNSAADIKHIFNRLQLDLGGAFTTLSFHNTPAIGGGTIFSVDRNRDVSEEFFDVGYDYGRGTEFFVRGTLNQRDYELPVSKFRNSTGYEAVGGVRLQLTNLISGQAYVGYMQQDYKTLTDIGGVDFGLQLDWAATRLTTVSAQVTRSIEETDEVGATGYFATTASLGVKHDLSRSITLRASAFYTNNEYHGVTRNEDIYGITVGGDYHFMPQVALGVDFTHTSRSSNVVGANYDQNLVEAQLKLAL
ncbi:MAG TPA: outer membrane beta-barrel protein [Rhizomicrobium sp.]|nr:outer membrane beta-barrel protein [Rhizomicrobium sp.]